MDDLARSLPEQLIHGGMLKSFSWGFVVASVTTAFLQELILDVKKKYKRGELKNRHLHVVVSVLGMGGAGYGLFVSPFGERYIVVGLAGVFWILFQIKKRRRGSKR